MQNKQISRIVVFRALQLGDMLCAVPAFRSLRHLYPHAWIVLIGLPWAKMFVDRYSKYINEFIPFPGMKGLPEQEYNPIEFEVFLNNIQNRDFDLAIQLQGSGEYTNDLIHSFHAQQNAGSYKGERPSRNFVPYRHDIHEIHRLLEVMKALGADVSNDEMQFPILDRDIHELQEKRLNLLPGSYVCVHAGARDTHRRWGSEYFALTADMLALYGYQVVLTGNDNELPLIQKIERRMRFRPIIAAGKTSLGGLAALIQDAAFLISNCTGVSHLAAALKTKSIILSLEKEPMRWAPLNKELHLTIVLKENILQKEHVVQIKNFLESSKHHLIRP